MNKKTHSQLLAEILLLPFIHKEFNSVDPISQYAAAYSNVIHQDRLVGIKNRNNILKEYLDSKKALIKLFSSDARWNHLDDVQLLLDMFYPGLKLQEYYNANEGEIGRFYLQHIFDIARVFVTFRDGIVSIRNWSKDTDPFLQSYTEFDKIELWNHISRTSVPDLFIAACYVNFNATTMGNLQNVPNLVYLADMPLKVILKKGVAETHMHANAGISYHDLWCHHTSLLSDSLIKKNIPQCFCTLFKLCSAIYISDKSDLRFDEYLFIMKEKLHYFSLFYDVIYSDNSYLSVTKTKLDRIYEEVKEQFCADLPDLRDILFSTVYREYRDRGTSSEIIWYCQVLEFLKKHYDSFLAECFFKYIRYKNDFFRDKVQQTRISGLDYFQAYYNNATEIPKIIGFDDERIAELRYKSIFEEQCKTGNLAVLEMKITPKIKTQNKTYVADISIIKTDMLRQVQKIFKAYYNYIKNRIELAGESSKLRFPKLGLMYHFIKQHHSDNFSGVNCAVRNDTAQIESFDYNSMRSVSINFLDALYELLQERPLLSDYIVGIDAASIENATEPWVFAPVFKRARSHKRIVPYSSLKGSNIQNIGFTYHVGEDFRHIISGLRHIDEVLTHFDYRSGDRLGHAVALGIDIDHLMMQNNIVAVPIMEYLENLLWMWQNSKLSDYGCAPGNLEFQIMETARKIYKNSLSGIDVYTLWRVYQAKFDILDETIRKEVLRENGCTLLKKFDTKEVWTFHELLCSHFCPCFHEIYYSPILIAIRDEELPFYKELQRNLLNKVERMGVYVETNPSSNLTISDIPSIFHHPILQLNNSGLHISNMEESSVMVSINSDDPIVFSTFAENEIAYIYYALLNAGCKREEALNWIDKIRLQGIESTFIKSDKQINEMLRDFEEIAKW